MIAPEIGYITFCIQALYLDNVDDIISISASKLLFSQTNKNSYEYWNSNN